ncbi:hypothetical protein [Domibacillus mangrovi]|nr:hypothetical protein [Domibacillus mangrovi]
MYPLIRKGDICRFVPCERSMIKKGDIILFQASGGGLVAHRLLKTISNHNQVDYLFKGDTNLGLDEPVSYEKIVGKLTSIQKGKRAIEATNVSVFLWCRLILFCPFMSVLLRTYLNNKEAKEL